MLESVIFFFFSSRRRHTRLQGDWSSDVCSSDLLQFEFAGRRSEIISLEWAWVDLDNRRVVWPDSKTGGMSKPLSEEAYRLLSTAPRRDGCPYVLPSPNDPAKHLTEGEYYGAWCRILKAAGATHVGTHGIRHRSARSEERRVGKECRSRWSPYHLKKN